MNTRKGKILIKLWLDKSELLSLEESIKLLNNDESNSKELGYAMSNISEIIQEIYNRGDLVK